MVEPESIDTRMVGWIFAGGSAIVAITIFFVWAFSNSLVHDATSASLESNAAHVAADRAAANESMMPKYRWIDKDKKRVSIPIEEAKRLVVRDFAQGH